MGGGAPPPDVPADRPSAARVVAASRPLPAAAAAAAVAATAASSASAPPPVPGAAPALLRAAGGGPTAEGAALLDRLERYAAAVREYHEPSVREWAQRVIPPHVLAAATRAGDGKSVAGAAADGASGAAAAGAAAAAAPASSDAAAPAAAARNDLATCPDARLTRALLTWFKADFFTWVDTLPCGACGGATTVTAMATPSAAERAGRASRVELHACGGCGAVARFARYAHPLTLLTTRRGRCGEWAQAFTAVAVAAGLTARLVVDSTDHLWTEVWSATARRWVHADACEAALDTPLLYEAGWGKRLAYILAAGEGVADVTRRYTARYPEVAARRTLGGEAWLAAALARRIAAALAALPPGAARDAAVARGVADWEALHGGGGSAWAPPPGQGGEGGPLPGRQSGAADWVHSRGEDGGA